MKRGTWSRFRSKGLLKRGPWSRFRSKGLLKRGPGVGSGVRDY